jgi:hypothetical protein
MSTIETGLHYPIDLASLPQSWQCDYVGALAESVQSGFACGAHNSDSDGIAHLRPMNISRGGRIELTDLRFVPAVSLFGRWVRSNSPQISVLPEPRMDTVLNRPLLRSKEGSCARRVLIYFFLAAFFFDAFFFLDAFLRKPVAIVAPQGIRTAFPLSTYRDQPAMAAAIVTISTVTRARISPIPPMPVQQT